MEVLLKGSHHYCPMPSAPAALTGGFASPGRVGMHLPHFAMTAALYRGWFVTVSWKCGRGSRIKFITVLNKSGGISSQQKTAAGFCNVVTGSTNYAMQIESIWLPPAPGPWQGLKACLATSFDLLPHVFLPVEWVSADGPCQATPSFIAVVCLCQSRSYFGPPRTYRSTGALLREG